ncbi:preprotein translocase subunit SecG [Putridiphycobacter roseus]|uniref:Protein-export membrane protein SecG n=1 Tax=Putridiphycobacter roseus TaxID=2219161 RepID=A0A2W1N222_9FLAO|nr:preprotein translocase subunit SecG [Putridiphycobacter roseus]PZE18327.1 preprotein translocase subunit SecG [Putridiphycobacter roseus]
MNTLLLIIIAVVSVALILFVLIQNPKGGGINSEFGSATQLGGAKRATDILEKGTWGLAIGIAVLCLILAISYKPSTTNVDDVDNIQIESSAENIPTDFEG